MMIKQINISNMRHLALQLNKAKSAGFSHFIPYSNDIKINHDMLEAINLTHNSIAVDYTLNGLYLNDCRYFGEDTLTFLSWMKILTTILILFSILTVLYYIYLSMIFNLLWI